MSTNFYQGKIKERPCKYCNTMFEPNTSKNTNCLPCQFSDARRKKYSKHLPYKIILKGEKPMSWNQLYSGSHWTVRSQEAKRVHALVRYSLSPKPKGVYTGRVGIVVKAYFDKRPYDSDNIATKIYIDGLKGNVIIDDTPKYVESVTSMSLVDKENPRVEIEVLPL